MELVTQLSLQDKVKVVYYKAVIQVCIFFFLWALKRVFASLANKFKLEEYRKHKNSG